MGVRLLHDTDRNLACFYCSTSDVAFGPVFYDDTDNARDADERAEAFLRWLNDFERCPWRTYEKYDILASSRRDPRELTDRGLERAYADWRDQEQAQWKREEDTERNELFDRR